MDKKPTFILILGKEHTEVKYEPILCTEQAQDFQDVLNKLVNRQH